MYICAQKKIPFLEYRYSEFPPKNLFTGELEVYDWLSFCTGRASIQQFNLVQLSSDNICSPKSIVGDSSDWLRWVDNHVTYHFFPYEEKSFNGWYSSSQVLTAKHVPYPQLTATSHPKLYPILRVIPAINERDALIVVWAGWNGNQKKTCGVRGVPERKNAWEVC